MEFTKQYDENSALQKKMRRNKFPIRNEPSVIQPYPGRETAIKEFIRADAVALCIGINDSTPKLISKGDLQAQRKTNVLLVFLRTHKKTEDLLVSNST